MRQAISAVSTGKIVSHKATSNFGWSVDGSQFLVPGGFITGDGFQATDQTVLSVDLQGEEHARNLGIKEERDPKEITRLKKHIVVDLLESHEHKVTYALLGSVGAALLYRFAGDVGRFALWLTGLTGTGKSFSSKLFQNFFGSYPLTSGRFVTWASTANYIQRQGYFFKDALYLVDDYKPEVSTPKEVVRTLQNYADGTGRGRLKVDTSTNSTRPIRGLLVSTGEDIPEHSASSVARSIIVTVPQLAKKDLNRGSRCTRECQNYSAVTADFVRWLLANRRTETFHRRVGNLQAYYYRNIAGQQNGERIAANFGLLAAGFLEFGRYLGDTWPDWKQRAKSFITKDLVAIRDEMLSEVKHQQASEIFLATLKELLRHNRCRIERATSGPDEQNKVPVIGKEVVLRRFGSKAALPANKIFFQISTAMALEAVQESLRRQARPPLKVTERTLLEQLRQDGKLVGPDGQTLAQDSSSSTQRLRIAGERSYCFTIDRAELVDKPPSRDWQMNGAPRPEIAEDGNPDLAWPFAEMVGSVSGPAAVQFVTGQPKP